jgi:uracil phosphoribosyltransferase
MENVWEMDHPLIAHHLTALRDRDSSSRKFRDIISRLTRLLTYEATKDLKTHPVKVETPLTTADGVHLSQRIGLVPILRAGLGMVDPVLDLIPDAEVWHLGFYRDENTLKPIEYYKKLPPGDPVDVGIILDPMLATGGSCVAAIEAVKSWGVPQVKLVSILAAPEGIERVHKDYADLQVYVCKIDSHLNENAYIVPGLGDAGDRIFNARTH